MSMRFALCGVWCGGLWLEERTPEQLKVEVE